MSDVLEYISQLEADDSVRLALEDALFAINGALHVYTPREIVFSFNGGKDSTVVLHCLRAACYQRSQGKSSLSMQDFRFVYFEDPDEFPEVLKFMEDCCRDYDISIERLPEFKIGISQLLADGVVRAVLIGTRRGDPDGANIGIFQPTSPGWPPMMRVSPLLEWDYGQIWRFLREAKLPYCKLYDDGYTSLGSVSTSKPNPSLLVPPGSAPVVLPGEAGAVAPGTHLPAYMLGDGELERAGRVKRSSKPKRRTGSQAAASPASGDGSDRKSSGTAASSDTKASCSASAAPETSGYPAKSGRANGGASAHATDPSSSRAAAGRADTLSTVPLFRRQSSYDPGEDRDAAGSDVSSDGELDNLAAAKLPSGVLARDRKDPGCVALAHALGRQDFGSLGLPALGWAAVSVRTSTSASSTSPSAAEVCFTVPVSSVASKESVEACVVQLLQAPRPQGGAAGSQADGAGHSSAATGSRAGPDWGSMSVTANRQTMRRMSGSTDGGSLAAAVEEGSPDGPDWVVDVVVGPASAAST